MPVSRPSLPVWVVAIAIVAATLTACQPARLDASSRGGHSR